MRCPKCDADMEDVVCESVVVNRCSDCKGLWFDHGNAEKYLKNWLAEQVDTGDVAVGQEQDAKDIVPCPRCGETMERFIDIDGTQILFEECDEHGQFFDAGEFTLWAAHYFS